MAEESGLKIDILSPFATWLGLRGKNKVFLVGYICKWLSGDVKLSEEHHKYEWVDKNDYKKFSEDNEYFRALEKYFEINGD